MAANTSITDPDREHRLLEQLEFRIASADSSSKLENILQKFLAALVLKLASETIQNRNLAIKVCQYISQRVKIDTSIQLPVESLFKTFSESQNAFVKQFCLLFIQQGLARLPLDKGATILPIALRSSIKERHTDRSDEKMNIIAFEFLCDVLRQWRLPERGSKQDVDLLPLFGLTKVQTDALVAAIVSFLLYDRKNAGLSSDGEELKAIYDRQFSQRSGLVPNIGRFLFSSIFNDEQRLIPAVVLSTDANAEAVSIADIMFKQCNFNLEAEPSIQSLFNLYDIGKPRLQIRVLSLLSKSQASTKHISKLLSIIETQFSSSATGLEAAKLRTAAFTYLTWATRVGKNLESIASQLQDSLKTFVELQGWPEPHDLSAGDVDLRLKAYEGIGLLAAVQLPTIEDQETSLIDMITWLFSSLRCDTTRDVKHSIEEALGRFMNSINISHTDDLKKLKELLLWNALAQLGDEDPVYYLPTKTIAQYPAVRFANKIFQFSDVDARYINVSVLDSERREVVEEANRGLDPYWHSSNLLLTGHLRGAKLELPSTADFIQRALPDMYTAKGDVRGGKKKHSQLIGTVVFSRNLIALSAWENAENHVEFAEDWTSRISALLDNDEKSRKLFQEHVNNLEQATLVCLLRASMLGMSFGLVQCADIAYQLTSMTSNDTLGLFASEALGLCNYASRFVNVQLQSGRCIGIILSLQNHVSDIIQTDLLACQDWHNAVGQDLQDITASLFKATYSLTRLSLRGSHTDNAVLLQSLSTLADQIIHKTTDKSLKEAALLTVTQIGLCYPPETMVSFDSFEMIEFVLKDAKKESEPAAMAIGALLNFKYRKLSLPQQTQVMDWIFELHEVRKAEFHFALGKALAVAALGYHATCMLTDFDVQSEFPTWGMQKDLFESLLTRCINECKTTKPALKKAAAIWLLSLVQYCSDSTMIRNHLRESQATFSRLLSDRDEIVQETGSKGLGVVYEKGDKNLRDDLVRDLVQSFTGSTAKVSGTVSEDTELFEAGALPTENGQSVTTYKDIVSLAQEMGDPSLVYRFMNLASNNSIWTSRAAFGRFGLSGVLADSTYLSDNKKFYPKLFRYRFDPNPNVQRSMDDIWRALVKDPNATIDQHFDLIMEDLLKSIVTGKEWRAREASCAAIADLVQGRDIAKYEHYLDEIWKVAFKVLDDVKETVRVAAMKLCRTLTAMLIRNLEVGEGNTKRATTLLEHAMPFLLQQIESGAAKEVQQYAIITLLDVVKKAPPKSLLKFSPVILETLIVSLSSLEHESINYLHLNADKYGLTAEKLDKMRVSSINSSPVTEAIEKCLESLDADSSDVQQPQSSDAMQVDQPVSPTADAMQRLERTFKTTIGLPSKVGLSRVMVTLVLRHQTLFRPYADRFMRITRKSILDRNATVSVSFSVALAYIARLASEKEIRHTSKYARKLYFESQEASHRAVAGEMVQAIAKVSGDVFLNFATIFLPFAFIGRQDNEADAKERFDTAWRENVGGSHALSLYLKDIAELISVHIKSSLWTIRHACCLAVADLVSSMGINQKYNDAEARTLWPLIEEAVAGKTWSGKEKVITAFPTFVKRAPTLWPDYTTQMKAIAIREAKRSNKEYQPFAISALGEFADARSDLDLAECIPSVVTHVFDELFDSDAMQVDDKAVIGSNAGQLADDTLAAGIKCLFACLRPQSPASILDQSVGLVEKAHQQRVPSLDKIVYDGQQQIVSKLTDEVKTKASENETGAEVSDEEKAAAWRRFAAGESGSASTSTDSANASTQARARESSFWRPWQDLVLLSLAGDPQRHIDATETLRKSRISLAVVFVQTGIPNLQARGTLADLFDTWLQVERSRPLRSLLEEAVRANRIWVEYASSLEGE